MTDFDGLPLYLSVLISIKAIAVFSSERCASGLFFQSMHLNLRRGKPMVFGIQVINWTFCSEIKNV